MASMALMFAGGKFNGDISKWDVSRVMDMESMFAGTTAFSGDISKWDVSSVTNMDHMFRGAESFKQQLCGAAWVHSKATKEGIFVGSSGSISQILCRAPSPQRWLARWRVTSTPIITPVTMTGISMCPTCGTFNKSGRVSCCAPGGAWYNNCGGAGNRNADHSWFEGVTACKRKSKAMTEGACLLVLLCTVTFMMFFSSRI